MCDCIFCNTKNGIIHETENFVVRVGKAIITPGHIMIIPKHHYLAMGEIEGSIVAEYLDLKNKVVNEITNKFSKPFLVEYGVYGQSVFHAHIHIIPSSGNGYKNVNLYNDFIANSLKKFDINPIEMKNFKELQDYYNKHKKYIYYEDSNKHCIIPVEKLSKDDIIFFGYRRYFTDFGLKGIRGWKDMTEEDKKLDEAKIEETISRINL